MRVEEGRVRPAGEMVTYPFHFEPERLPECDSDAERLTLFQILF